MKYSPQTSDILRNLVKSLRMTGDVIWDKIDERYFLLVSLVSNKVGYTLMFGRLITLNERLKDLNMKVRSISVDPIQIKLTQDVIETISPIRIYLSNK